MICRNCSAEIDAVFEICPYCKKDPRKRGYFGKTGIVLVLVFLAVVSAVVYASLNFPEIKSFAVSAASKVASFQIEQRRCTGEEIPTSATGETVQSTVNTTGAVSFDLCSAPVNEVFVAGADGKPISSCGVITAKKAQLKDITQAQFKSFCLQRITRSRYLWLTVRFEDSTGIVFFGNNASSAVYCKLDETDAIKEILGNIILSDSGNYIYVDVR